MRHKRQVRSSLSHHYRLKMFKTKKQSVFALVTVIFITLITSGELRAQLSDADIAELKARAREEGWTFKVGQNPATNYSLEQLCGLVEPEDWRSRKGEFIQSELLEELPEAFDWRDVAGCPPVRSQGGCGSCWAFATVGPLECAIMIDSGLEVNLSEQWLVSCNQSGWGCGGGWWAHDYHKCEDGQVDYCGDSGAVLEADFPYQASDVACDCPYPHNYCIDSFAYVSSSSDVPEVNDIKQAIMDHGPISVAVYVDSAFQGYTGGVFNACTSGVVNHGVVLVGWDDNPTDGDPGCPGVWIMRNSWGSGWGEDGHMRIEYGCSQIGYAACYINYSPPEFQVTPLNGFVSVGDEGGPFDPCSMTYTLTNNSDTDAVEWTADYDEPWLDVFPDSGVLSPGGTAQVEVSFTTVADSLPVGAYTDMVTFSNGQTHQRGVALVVGIRDYFTELFGAGDNDIDNKTLILIPDDSINYYRACAKEAATFPTDPTGGLTLSLGDDAYTEVTLGGGKQVWLYGESYSSFYVGSNGYINFISGDADYSESLGEHFALKRISALFDDLNPNTGGTITVKELADRVAVTFENVPEYYSSGSNSFQVEMFADEILRITWLGISATDGLVGLSNGEGFPPYFIESDLSEYGSISGDFEPDCDVDFYDFVVFGLAWLSSPGDDNWYQPCDISLPADDIINELDLKVFCGNWLEGAIQ